MGTYKEIQETYEELEKAVKELGQFQLSISSDAEKPEGNAREDSPGKYFDD